MGRDAFVGAGVYAATGKIYGYLGDWSQAAWGTVGGISYDVSTSATVTVNGALVSLWENNLVAVRAEAEYGFLVNDTACVRQARQQRLIGVAAGRRRRATPSRTARGQTTKTVDLVSPWGSKVTVAAEQADVSRTPATPPASRTGGGQHGLVPRRRRPGTVRHDRRRRRLQAMIEDAEAMAVLAAPCIAADGFAS